MMTAKWLREWDEYVRPYLVEIKDEDIGKGLFPYGVAPLIEDAPEKAKEIYSNYIEFLKTGLK